MKQPPRSLIASQDIGLSDPLSQALPSSPERTGSGNPLVTLKTRNLMCVGRKGIEVTIGFTVMRHPSRDIDISYRGLSSLEDGPSPLSHIDMAVHYRRWCGHNVHGGIRV
jgi:hypothetical protein